MIDSLKECVTSDAIKTLIYIDSYEDMDMRGRLYNQFLRSMVSFHGVCDFITKLQQLFDGLSFPQETFCLRKFDCKRKRKKEKVVEIMGNKVIEMNSTDAKFLIHVKCRQNASWQGTIKWLDTNEEMQFRSALELIKLMDQALSNSDEVMVEWTKQA